MKYLPNNTLRYWQSVPQLKARVLTELPVKVLAKATTEYRKHCGLVVPDEQAISFYALNHCAALVRAKFTLNEVLPMWAQTVMEKYTDQLVAQAERNLHYIVSIITREARHTHSPTDTLLAKVKLQGGLEMVDFLATIRGNNEEMAVKAYMAYSGKATVGQYVQVMETVFNNGKWGGGYGGKPWGQIATTALSVLQGKTTLEMMVDTAYTLAHNNGPMYNKGMMYNGYTGSFIMILDVQRSGQIPELLLDSTVWVTSPGLFDSGVRSVVQLVKAETPESFGEWVDWQKVMDLGAKGSYGSFNEKQKKLHGKPVIQLFNGKPATHIGVFQVWPDQAVQMYKRA